MNRTRDDRIHIDPGTGNHRATHSPFSHDPRHQDRFTPLHAALERRPGMSTPGQTHQREDRCSQQTNSINRKEFMMAAFGNENRGRQRRDKEPQKLATVAARITSMEPSADDDKLVVKVEIADGTRKALGLDPDVPEVALVMHENSRKMGGLRGLFENIKGGGASQEVVPGCIIGLDQVRKEDGQTISANWFTAIVGKKQYLDQEKEGLERAVILDGHFQTYRRTREDGSPYWKAVMLQPEKAEAVNGLDEIRDGLVQALEQDGPGDPLGVLRLSTDAGETGNFTVQQRWNKDTQSYDSPADSVQWWITHSERGKKLAEYLDEATAVEIIPGADLPIGRESSAILETAFNEKLGKGKLALGSSRITVAEIPREMRQDRPQGSSTAEPSQSQLNFVRDIATSRKRDVPDEVKKSKLAATAWIGENKFQPGFAAGQAVVRPFKIEDKDETVQLVTAVCHDNRAGVPLNAINTPAAPGAYQFVRAQCKDAAAAREDILSGAARAAQEAEEAAQHEARVTETSIADLSAPPSRDPDDDHDIPGLSS